MCYCESGVEGDAVCELEECQSLEAPLSANTCSDPGAWYGEYLAAYYQELKANPHKYASILSDASRFLTQIHQTHPREN